MPIAGTGEQVTLGISEVVQLMEAYHIPFCSAIYNAALRLYMNGNLMVSSKPEDSKVSSPVKVFTYERRLLNMASVIDQIDLYLKNCLIQTRFQTGGIF